MPEPRSRRGRGDVPAGLRRRARAADRPARPERRHCPDRPLQRSRTADRRAGTGGGTGSGSEPEPEVVAEAPPLPPKSRSEAEPPEEPARRLRPRRNPPELPEEEGLPPVKHVFVIVLGENGYEETYGPTSTAPYLSKTLPEKGELLSNYYAVTQGRPGQRDRPASAARARPRKRRRTAPNYTDIVARHRSIATTGQVEGERLRLSRRSRNAAGPAGRGEKELEGLRRGTSATATRGSRPPAATPCSADPTPAQAPRAGRPLRDLAQPVRLLPLAARRPRMRRTTTSASNSSAPT